MIEKHVLSFHGHHSSRQPISLFSVTLMWLTSRSDEYAAAFAIRRLLRRLVGGFAKIYACTEQLLKAVGFKERSGTHPIMKTHHEADQITGRCGTPTFEIKDCPLHAQLVLACTHACVPLIVLLCSFLVLVKSWFLLRS